MRDEFLAQLNPIVKDAYLEYKENSKEFDCMPYLEENGDDRRFYVYEWYTKNPRMVFYVGRGTGKRYHHIISDMERSRGDDYKALQDKYGIEHRIVLDGLTDQEATIYETYLIWKREQEGEVLIQFVFAESYWAGHDTEREKIENGIRPNIWIPPVIKRYFPERISELPEYDEIDENAIRNAYLTQTHTDNAKQIIKMIESRGGRVFKSAAKKATCVIDFLVTDYDKYLLYREKGYRIYHFLDVIKFFNEG